MSGAGRSEAAHVLEDLGFFVIDNLPPMLIGKVAELARGQRHAELATRSWSTSVRATSCRISPPRSTSCDRQGVTTRVLYLDAGDDVLVRRYEESRRRHPLSDSERVSDGIARERALLEPLVGEADLRVDTSSLNVHELRDRLRELFSDHGSDDDVQVNVVSFGYKHGLPLDVDLVFDCRFLPNPHWVEELRPLTGLDEPVRDYVLAQRGHARVPRRARPAVRPAPARLRTGGKGVSLDRVRVHRRPASQRRDRRTARRTPAPPGSPRRGAPPGRRTWRLTRRANASVVALGGGHGLAIALRAAREYAGDITAVVSVADDGGSSGRLRRDLGVAAPGDLRKSLVALAASDGPWPAAFEHRFGNGELAGHSLGNLVIVGLAETLGDLNAALAEAGRLLGVAGRVDPGHRRCGHAQGRHRWRVRRRPGRRRVRRGAAPR